MNTVMSSTSSRRRVQQTTTTDYKPDNEALTEQISAVQEELSRTTDKLDWFIFSRSWYEQYGIFIQLRFFCARKQRVSVSILAMIYLSTYFGCSLWVSTIAGVVSFQVLPHHTCGTQMKEITTQLMNMKKVCLKRLLCNKFNHQNSSISPTVWWAKSSIFYAA